MAVENTNPGSKDYGVFGVPKGQDGGNQLDADVQVMKAVGLKDNEIAMLSAVKRRVGQGICDDLTMEYKRMTFAKLLVQSGRISG